MGGNHELVYPDNIDSGHSSFQLDPPYSGCRRNLDYLLIRRPPLKHAANSSTVQDGGKRRRSDMPLRRYSDFDVSFGNSEASTWRAPEPDNVVPNTVFASDKNTSSASHDRGCGGNLIKLGDYRLGQYPPFIWATSVFNSATSSSSFALFNVFDWWCNGFLLFLS
jgi:hypothetical protein